MATAPSQNLPDALKSIRTRPLFVLRLQVPPYYVVGATPGAFRRIGIVLGGLFEGERLSGEVLGGNDWQAVRNDGCTKLDVRIVLKATDGALIVMTYQALRHGPRDVMEKLDEGKPVDPASYYFRMNPATSPTLAKDAGQSRLRSMKQYRPKFLPRRFMSDLVLGARRTLPTSCCPRCGMNSADMWRSPTANPKSLEAEDKCELSVLSANHRSASRGIAFAIVLYGPKGDRRQGDGRRTRY
jgi:hypothetical protein